MKKKEVGLEISTFGGKKSGKFKNTSPNLRKKYRYLMLSLEPKSLYPEQDKFQKT